MTVDPVTVKASLLQGLDDFLRRRGVDHRSVLAASGVSSDTIEQKFADITFSQFAAVLECAAEQSRDPCLGLEWAEEIPAGGAGLFGYLVLNAATLRDALRNLVHYARLLTNPVDATFSEDADGGIATWQWPGDTAIDAAQASSFFVALLVDRLRRASQETWDPTLVELAHRPLKCEEAARRIFRCPVEYNAPRHAVHFDKASLDRKFHAADPNLLPYVRLLGDQMLQGLKATGSLLDQTRLAIFEGLDKGKVKLSEVARRLNMSPRALQARLRESGTSFYVLVSETRATAARRYLRDTDLPLAEIAFLLGFSEQSAFTRASQRWFGDSPSAIRQRLRTPGAVVEDLYGRRASGTASVDAK